MSRSPEELAHEVVMLHRQGMRDRTIGRALRVGRNRIRRILRAHDAARSGDAPPSALPPAPVKRPSVLDAHASFIANLLARFPDITAQRVYEELCGREDLVFEGRYTIVKQYVRALRPKPVIEVSTPVEEPEPGKVAECDWASISIDFKNGTRKKLQVFGYTLAYSHRRYYRLYDRADFHSLLDGHVEAFGHMDGVAEECKYVDLFHSEHPPIERPGTDVPSGRWWMGQFWSGRWVNLGTAGIRAWSPRIRQRARQAMGRSSER